MIATLISLVLNLGHVASNPDQTLDHLDIIQHCGEPVHVFAAIEQDGLLHLYSGEPPPNLRDIVRVVMRQGGIVHRIETHEDCSST